MIHKYFVITPTRVFFTNSADDFEDVVKVKLIEVRMPLDVFNSVNSKMQETDYMSTSGHVVSDITESFRSIFNDLSKYAVYEKDRGWLFDQARK